MNLGRSLHSTGRSAPLNAGSGLKVMRPPEAGPEINAIAGAPPERARAIRLGALLSSRHLRRLEQEAKGVSQNGGAVWLETTAIESLAAEHAEFQSWLATQTREGAKRKLVYPGYRNRLVQLFPQDEPEGMSRAP